MTVAAALLIQALAAPTLGEVLALSPGDAGRLVLQGQAHGRVEMVVEARPNGLAPPGMVELHLIEEATAHDGYCSRLRWEASFFHGPEARNAATLGSAYATTEVALTAADTCPGAGYVHLNPNVGPEEAFAALSRLDQLRAGTLGVEIACADETASELCVDDTVIRAQLGRLAPWAVTREGTAILLWLGERGDIATEVRFDARSPGQVDVHRFVPPPF